MDENEKWNIYFDEFNTKIENNKYYKYDIKENNIYNMSKYRKDWRDKIVYSIDPEGCQDADDAFSIWEEKEIIHLLIHIADPTSYFSPYINNGLFREMIENKCSIYITGKSPRNMFSENLIKKCSLIDGDKYVISIHILLKPIYKKNMFKIINSEIEYGIINCDVSKNYKRFNYNSAAKELYKDNILLIGIEIAKTFWNIRKSDNQDGFMFSDLYNSVPIMDNNKKYVILEKDNKAVKVMKSMICEFAIYANYIFAKNMNNNKIYRKLIYNSQNKNETEIDKIHNIIREGYSAKYTTEKLPHNLIGYELYTHGTSPLRRASDCLVHFLIKIDKLGISSPFNINELNNWILSINNKCKIIKKLQFTDIKIRTLQWISQQLYLNNILKIRCKVINYTGLFLNILIIKINKLNVNISYSLKRIYKNLPEYSKIGYTIDIIISKIYFPNKYDEGIFPEIDEYFK
jgi:ribonuclease R